MTQKRKELIRTIKFALFSISAGAIQIVSFTLFEEIFHLTHWLSYLISLVFLVVWNFTLSRRRTIRTRLKHRVLVTFKTEVRIILRRLTVATPSALPITFPLQWKSFLFFILCSLRFQPGGQLPSQAKALCGMNTLFCY